MYGIQEWSLHLSGIEEKWNSEICYEKTVTKTASSFICLLFHLVFHCLRKGCLIVNCSMISFAYQYLHDYVKGAGEDDHANLAEAKITWNETVRDSAKRSLCFTLTRHALVGGCFAAHFLTGTNFWEKETNSRVCKIRNEDLTLPSRREQINFFYVGKSSAVSSSF